MDIFELNQACTRRTCSGSSPSASGYVGRALATLFRGVATTALDAKGSADNVSELLFEMGELGAMLASSRSCLESARP